MRTLSTFVLFLAIATVRPAAAAEGRSLPRVTVARPSSQVVAEIGLAMPRGDLGADFQDDEHGFGAGNGLELGFRWRFHLSSRFSLAPSFTFTNFDDHDDFRYDLVEEETVPAPVKTSSFGYGLEARYAAGSPGRFWVPFVALEAGLQRLRVEGWQKDFSAVIDQPVNILGLAARVGVRIDQFELSLVYRLDRFTTRQFFATGTAQDYSWDTLVARMGWVIPF